MQASRFSATLVLCAWLAQLNPAAHRAYAADPNPARDLPTQPTRPEIPSPSIPEDVFRCDRTFVFQGKQLPCDSNTRADGEGLRPILQEVPSALEELDTYQANRAKVRTAAYLGTIGFVVMIAGSLLSLKFRSPTGAPTDNSATVLTVAILAGGGIAVGGFLYALSSNTSNEAHLNRAVELFNEARPKTPIQLQFSTSFDL